MGKRRRNRSRTRRRTASTKQVPKRCPIEQVQHIADRRRKTLAALGRIETDLREACDLARAHGATLRQLGDRMGVSPQAVHRYWTSR